MQNASQFMVFQNAVDAIDYQFVYCYLYIKFS